MHSFTGQLLEVRCAAAADPVKQITRAVRASTAATADYDALVDEMGRKASLTPSRSNGFLNLFKRVQDEARLLMGGA